MPTYVVYKCYNEITGSYVTELDIVYNCREGDLIKAIYKMQQSLGSEWYGNVKTVDRQTFENLLLEMMKDGLPA